MCSPSGIRVDSPTHVLINVVFDNNIKRKNPVSVSSTLNNAQQQLATDMNQKSKKHDENFLLKKDLIFST